jgi:predicted CoA-binding protein
MESTRSRRSLMATREMVRNILEKYRNIAVFGMSKDPGKQAHWIPEFLASKGYEILCVNPTVESVEKWECYPDLASIPKRIDIVQVFRRSEEALEPVKEAVARKKEKGDVYVVWLQRGIRNEEARKLAEENDIFFVQDRCMYHEFREMYPLET